MAIRIVCAGLPSANSTLLTIQRGGKRFVLVTVINVETSPDRIGEFDPNAAVSFGVEEFPENILKKLFASTDPDEDAGVIIAFHDGKTMSGDDLQAICDYVRRVMKATPVSEYKRQG
ncbi:hypothetical protein GOL31_23640 [Sinorhizobium medicae]|nr:hypothetical protein [Sinorhizobium medicae]